MPQSSLRTCTVSAHKTAIILYESSIVDSNLNITDFQVHARGMHMSVGDHFDDDESLFGLASHSDSDDEDDIDADEGTVSHSTAPKAVSIDPLRDMEVYIALLSHICSPTPG